MEEKDRTYRNYSFPKKERLSSKKLIDALFSKGASFHLYPFSVRYLVVESDADCHQFMISVSKRKFKRAVDRNRIKRLAKEAYRLHKHQLIDLPESGKFLAIAYIYTAKEIHKYSFVETKLVESLRRLKNKLVKTQEVKNIDS